MVQALKATLLAGTAPSDRTSNVDAYSLLLQGRFLDARQTEADTRQAIRVQQRAIGLAPNYAAAWVELSRAYFLLFAYVDKGDEPEQDLERAHAAAQKAVTLEPSSAEAHLMLAQVKALYEQLERRLRRSTPHDAPIQASQSQWNWFSSRIAIQGRALTNSF